MQWSHTLVHDDTKLEAEIRKEIDTKLEAAGWAVAEPDSTSPRTR